MTFVATNSSKVKQSLFIILKLKWTKFCEMESYVRKLNSTTFIILSKYLQVLHYYWEMQWLISAAHVCLYLIAWFTKSFLIFAPKLKQLSSSVTCLGFILGIFKLRYFHIVQSVHWRKHQDWANPKRAAQVRI